MTDTTTNILVETIDLTKCYGEVTAVDKLNLQVEKGTIFGLLGPNGAGKTTTILMLLGLTEPTGGKALIAGYDSTYNPIKVKSIVGYLPDNIGFYQDMTGFENLQFTAELNGLPSDEARSRIQKALERVGLKDMANRKVAEYSRGMRQRLGIADVLVKDPPLIIMDEPTLGIDPEGVRELLTLIKNLSQKDGRTLLISSHLLHQVQEICDRVGIFVKGKMIASGTIDELGTQLLAGQQLKIEVRAEPLGEELVNTLKSVKDVKDIKRQGQMLILSCSSDVRKEISRKLINNGFELLHLYLRGISLNDIYQQYFQKEGYHGNAGNQE